MSDAVVVTGGSGFIGSNAVARMRADGRTVFAPTRGELNLLDTDAVAAYLRERSATTVVHLAASLDKSSESAQWHDTFDVGRSVLYAAEKSDIALLVYGGTMDEVGKAQGIVGPDEPLCPLNTYGLCKALVLEVARFLATRSKMQIEWVRPTTVYGPGQTGPMLVPAAFKDAVQGSEAKFTSGEQKRDFIYVGDVAEWMNLASQITPQGNGVTIHHLGSGNSIAVKDVLNRISELSGTHFELGAIPRREGEPDLIGVPPYSDTRAPLAGWAPSVDIKDGLERTWQWWKEMNV